eukprot:scaffold110236_cov40-Cyclotella_meneghiniana.AAC.2
MTAIALGHSTSVLLIRGGKIIPGTHAKCYYRVRKFQAPANTSNHSWLQSGCSDCTDCSDC